MTKTHDPFRYSHWLPKVIRALVVLYVRDPLSRRMQRFRHMKSLQNFGVQKRERLALNVPGEDRLVLD